MPPVKLADGTLFDPKSKRVMKAKEEAPSDNPLRETSFVPAPKTSYRLEELPADKKQMSVIAAILGFKFMGVPDTDICLALGCDFEQLQSICATEAFTKSQQFMIDAFVAGQTNAARDIILNNARYAANTLVEGLQAKKVSDRLNSAKSILDRAGIGEDKSNGGDLGGLVIKVVRDADATGIEVKFGA